jgi:hypothetical protein
MLLMKNYINMMNFYHFYAFVFQILTSSHLSKKLNYISNFSSCFTGLVFVFKHQVALENVVEWNYSIS